MSSQEMYQLWQVLYDQIDSQVYPEVYPEQVFDFLNVEQDKWVTLARKSFEQSTELAEYLLPLVQDITIPKSLSSTSTQAVYKLAEGKSKGETIPFRSLAAVNYAACTFAGIQGLCYLKEQTHNQRSATSQSPFGKPRPYLCYYRLVDNSVKVDVTDKIELGELEATIVAEPLPISREQDCQLPASTHRLLVEMSVASAKQKLQPVQQ